MNFDQLFVPANTEVLCYVFGIISVLFVHTYAQLTNNGTYVRT